MKSDHETDTEANRPGPNQQPLEIHHRGAIMRGMTYRPAPSGRFATVLFLHSFTGQRIEHGYMFVQLARALCEQGAAAVTFDFRHSGESDGSFDQMLVSGELDDALKVTQWVQAQPFVDRSQLGIVGFSLGGLLAACLQAQTAAFNAIALIAPTTADNLSRYAGNKRVDGRIVVGPHTLHEDFIDDICTHDGLADIVKHPRPTLVVQGSADVVVKPEVSQQYIDALQRADVTVTSYLIDEADHLFSRFEIRQKFVAIVSAWLAEHLAT